jgi:hypothetical protein
MECIFSEKQKEIRYIKSFKFRFHKILQGEVQWWTCWKNSCLFFKLSSNNVLLEIYNEHSMMEKYLLDRKPEMLLKGKLRMIFLPNNRKFYIMNLKMMTFQLSQQTTLF